MLGNEVIDLDKLTKPELIPLRRRRGFFCMQCQKPVVFKNGTRKRAHFSHEKEGVSISNPESAAHILVKHSLARWLEEQQVMVEVEKRFPQIDRIADVYFEYQNLQYVLEIQKSPMSDAEFNQRVNDYQSINATVLWIFLGNVSEKDSRFRLPPVMLGREIPRLFHFCVRTAKLQIFKAPVFLTTREIYANPIRGKLTEFSVESLLEVEVGGERVHFDESWLEIKKRFRKQCWFYASKSERKLLEQCLIRGFNLSLLPTEVGWPVAGAGMKKSLFVWQAYILLTVMKYFNHGAVFSARDLLNHLNIEYKVIASEVVYGQVVAYLKWLVIFGIVKEEKSGFKCIKTPEIVLTLEDALKRDQKFVEVVRNFWKV